MIKIQEGKKYLITGGAGFLGGELIDRILEQGGEVITVSRNEGKLIELKSLNFSKKKRNSNKIKLIILHYTGMLSMRASIKRLTNKRHEVSCHYLISRKGKVYQLVDDNKIAWHAGKSKWDYFKDLNDKSIGIELENKGHKFGYQKYPDKQINALIKICIKLKKKYKK